MLPLIACLLSGCECAPARSKHWRHQPDPKAVPTEGLGIPKATSDRARRMQIQKRRAQTLRIHVDADPGHLNPLSDPTTWTRRIMVDTVFETLIRYRPPPDGAGSGPGSYQPGLAQSWRSSPGSILVEIHPAARFQNGDKVTSVDVQFSIDSALYSKQAASQWRAMLADISKVVLVNDRAVRIYLSRPNGYVLRALAEVPILPWNIYKNRIGWRKGPVVGSGPYKLLSSEAGVIHLVRDPKYWGLAPAIRDLVFVYEPDAAKALTAAKRGELDLIPELIPAHYPEQASAPGLVQSFDPLRLRPSRFHYLAIDAAHAPFDDRRVRTAVALLIDRAKLVKEYHGLVRPVAGPIWPGGLGDGPAPAAPPFDPKRAGELLDQAGWRDVDGDGKRERAGTRLRVSLLASDRKDPVHKHVVHALERSGFSVDVRIGSPAVLLKRLTEGAFDLATLEWRGLVDQDLWSLLHSKGSRNYGGFRSAKIDDLLVQLRAAAEPRARARLHGKLAAAIASQWPLAPLFAPHPYGLLHKRVRGAVVWDGWISLRALSLGSAPPPE